MQAMGRNFARSRLLLARRAGYLPGNVPIDPVNATEQWKAVSSNLARDARAAGFSNPLMFLRTGATTGGQLPKPTAMRPGAMADPTGSLPYANSRMAAAGINVPQVSPVGWGEPTVRPPMQPQDFTMQAQRRLPNLPTVSRRGGRNSTVM